jgi:hypothetical protein
VSRAKKPAAGSAGWLSEVEHGGFVEISRYQDPAAIMVPPDWYQRAVEALGEPASDSA